MRSSLKWRCDGDEEETGSEECKLRAPSVARPRPRPHTSSSRCTASFASSASSSALAPAARVVAGVFTASLVLFIVPLVALLGEEGLATLDLGHDTGTCEVRGHPLLRELTLRGMQYSES